MSWQINVPAEQAYPTCGSCLGETDGDPDGVWCEDCSLHWTWDSLDTAEPLNDEDAACGTPCDNLYHRGQHWTCGACVLPAGHPNNMHHTDCTPRPREDQTND